MTAGDPETQSLTPAYPQIDATQRVWPHAACQPRLSLYVTHSSWAATAADTADRHMLQRRHARCVYRLGSEICQPMWAARSAAAAARRLRTPPALLTLAGWPISLIRQPSSAPCSASRCRWSGTTCSRWVQFLLSVGTADTVDLTR